jgi:hypothetical protein
MTPWDLHEEERLAIPPQGCTGASPDISNAHATASRPSALISGAACSTGLSTATASQAGAMDVDDEAAPPPPSGPPPESVVDAEARRVEWVYRFEELLQAVVLAYEPGSAAAFQLQPNSSVDVRIAAFFSLL